MKKAAFPVILSLLVLLPALRITAQESANLISTSFDMTGFPQWSKDLRRWEIVAFGSFPFSMFVTTFITDSLRWSKENDMDWSEEGRRYAPWPFKSAGAVDMTNREQEMTLAIAAGISGAIALADFIIVQVKRNKERRRIESLPPGTAIIIRKPYPQDNSDYGSDSGPDSDWGGDASDAASVPAAPAAAGPAIAGPDAPENAAR